ncbi:prolyl 4-hydroxylase subunit alpha-1-like [Micropterus salmoides]|uniref:prolyl 4-hydroxylase subunit alpha-1-like n=1 Tax=Micropterus salmoides TaxID=27706 RepID=UPI0018EB797C|nr:prolyl 4-hydroxylase subunit alpha-1-like [Micropterus salmoides]
MKTKRTDIIRFSCHIHYFRYSKSRIRNTTAEDLQVANYGVGGQYEPHFDFGRKDEPDVFEELGTGNRIATWLLYMSDVQAGGATVFTDVGASVRPKKVQFTLVLQLHQASDRVKISN